MKKRVITGIAALVVLAVAWCTIPRPLVQDSYQLDYIEYQGETIHFHDESFKAEREAIETLIRTYQRSAVARRLPWDGYGSLCLTGGDSRRPVVFLFIEKRDPVAARGKRAHGGGSDAARAAGDNNIHK